MMFFRCSSIRSRVVRNLPSFAPAVSSRSGTPGGGGGGGVPSSTSITHLPRSTGDVRLPSVVWILHALELPTGDVGNAVMVRESLVDERVIGREQLEYGAVGAHDLEE